MSSQRERILASALSQSEKEELLGMLEDDEDVDDFQPDQRDPLDRLGLLDLLDEDPDVYQDFISSGFNDVEVEKKMIDDRIAERQRYFSSCWNFQCVPPPTQIADALKSEVNGLRFPHIHQPIVLTSSDRRKAKLECVNVQNCDLEPKKVTEKKFRRRAEKVSGELSRPHLSDIPALDYPTVGVADSTSVEKIVREYHPSFKYGIQAVKALDGPTRKLQLRYDDPKDLDSRPSVILVVADSTSEADKRILMMTDYLGRGLLATNEVVRARYALAHGLSVITSSHKVYSMSRRIRRGSYVPPFWRFVICTKQTFPRWYPHNDVIYSDLPICETLDKTFKPRSMTRSPLSLYDTMCFMNQVDTSLELPLPRVKFKTY